MCTSASEFQGSFGIKLQIMGAPRNKKNKESCHTGKHTPMTVDERSASTHHCQSIAACWKEARDSRLAQDDLVAKIGLGAGILEYFWKASTGL